MYDYYDTGDEIICKYVLASNEQRCFTYSGSYFIHKGEGGDLVVFDDYIVLQRSSQEDFFDSVSSETTYAYVIDVNYDSLNYTRF